MYWKYGEYHLCEQDFINTIRCKHELTNKSALVLSFNNYMNEKYNVINAPTVETKTSNREIWQGTWSSNKNLSQKYLYYNYLVI